MGSCYVLAKLMSNFCKEIGALTCTQRVGRGLRRPCEVVDKGLQLTFQKIMRCQLIDPSQMKRYPNRALRRRMPFSLHAWRSPPQPRSEQQTHLYHMFNLWYSEFKNYRKINSDMRQIKN